MHGQSSVLSKLSLNLKENKFKLSIICQFQLLRIELLSWRAKSSCFNNKNKKKKDGWGYKWAEHADLDFNLVQKSQVQIKSPFATRASCGLSALEVELELELELIELREVLLQDIED